MNKSLRTKYAVPVCSTPEFISKFRLASVPASPVSPLPPCNATDHENLFLNTLPSTVIGTSNEPESVSIPSVTVMVAEGVVLPFSESCTVMPEGMPVISPIVARTISAPLYACTKKEVTAALAAVSPPSNVWASLVSNTV